MNTSVTRLCMARSIGNSPLFTVSRSTMPSSFSMNKFRFSYFSNPIFRSVPLKKFSLTNSKFDHIYNSIVHISNAENQGFNYTKWPKTDTQTTLDNYKVEQNIFDNSQILFFNFQDSSKAIDFSFSKNILYRLNPDKTLGDSVLKNAFRFYMNNTDSIATLQQNVIQSCTLNAANAVDIISGQLKLDYNNILKNRVMGTGFPLGFQSIFDKTDSNSISYNNISNSWYNENQGIHFISIFNNRIDRSIKFCIFDTLLLNANGASLMTLVSNIETARYYIDNCLFNNITAVEQLFLMQLSVISIKNSAFIKIKSNYLAQVTNETLNKPFKQEFNLTECYFDKSYGFPSPESLQSYNVNSNHDGEIQTPNFNQSSLGKIHTIDFAALKLPISPTFSATMDIPTYHETENANSYVPAAQQPGTAAIIVGVAFLFYFVFSVYARGKRARFSVVGNYEVEARKIDKADSLFSCLKNTKSSDEELDEIVSDGDEVESAPISKSSKKPKSKAGKRFDSASDYSQSGSYSNKKGGKKNAKRRKSQSGSGSENNSES